MNYFNPVNPEPWNNLVTFFRKKSCTDDLEISKAHKNTRIKYGRIMIMYCGSNAIYLYAYFKHARYVIRVL